MRRRISHVGVIFVVVLSLTALLFSACAAPEPAAPAPAMVELTVWHTTAAAIPSVVAQKEGFFAEQGLKMDVRPTVEDEAPFLAGQSPICGLSTWDAAEFRIEGEDIIVFGTSGGIRFFNGIAILPENAAKYKTAKDLVGKKLGNPGFGTGTWGAFTGLAREVWGIDTMKDYDNVTASSGALLGLLEKGEIEGALLFSGQTVSALASGFPLVFRFDEAWESFTGQPLLISQPIGRTKWVKGNMDTARRYTTALEKATVWMTQNPTQFLVGGKYETFARDAGWHKNDETSYLMQTWLKEGTYYVSRDTYTQAYIDSAQKFNELIFGDKAPPIEELFVSPVDMGLK